MAVAMGDSMGGGAGDDGNHTQERRPGMTNHQFARSTLAGLALAAAVCGTRPAWGQSTTIANPDASGVPAEDNEGRRALRSAADAIKSLSWISYRGKYTMTGSIAQLVDYSTEGDALLLRSGNAWIMQVTGVRTPKKGDPFEVNVLWVGDRSVEYLDHEKKTLMERPIREARGQYFMSAKDIREDDMLAADPFQKQFGSGVFTLEPNETVDGVECRVVSVTMGPPQAGGNPAKKPAAGTVVRYCLGVEDQLPRRIVRATPGGELVREFADVRSGRDSAPYSLDTLRLPLPEGYTEDRTKPPAPTPPPEPAPPKDPAGGLKPGEGTPASNPTGEAPHPAPAPPPEPPKPRTLPEFDLIKFGTSEHVTSDTLRGSVSVVEFFGTWSLPAREWHPRLEDVVKQHASEGVKGYAVSVRERDLAKAVSHLRELAPSLTHLTPGMNVSDAGEGLARAFGVQVFPAAAVVNAAGEIVEVVQGARGDDDAAALDQAIAKALGKPVPPASSPAAPSAAPSAGAPSSGSVATPEGAGQK
jgi:hypothetical protein